MRAVDGAIVVSGSMPTDEGMWVSGGLDIQGEGSGTAALTGDGGVSVRYTGESLGELDLMPEFLRAHHSSYTDWLKRGR